MRLTGLALMGFLAMAVSAQYNYEYSYGYDFYDDDGYGYGGYSYGGYGYESYGDGNSYGDRDDNGYSYGSSYGSETTGDNFFGYNSYYDEYGYYGDADQSYYEYYGYYTDDFAGYEDYYTEEYNWHEECFFDANGKPVLINGTASCNLKISGVDKEADRLTGGIDGTYTLESCFNGKAMYRRKKSPAGEDRVMWYSSTFGDWDVSKGSEPSEADILMYGGEMEHASTPLFVSSWHLGGDLRSGGIEDEYAPINAKIACSDGTKYKEGEVKTNTQRTGPALTDAEIEAKYQYIYNKYKTVEPSPTINFTFVVLLVMTGLTIVLAIPYFLLKKKGYKHGGGEKISTSFAAMLQKSRKTSTGHTA